MTPERDIAMLNTIGHCIHEHSFPGAVQDIIVFGSAAVCPSEAADINIALVHNHPPLHVVLEAARNNIIAQARRGILHQFDYHVVTAALGSHTALSYMSAAKEFTGDMHTEWPIFQQQFVLSKVRSIIGASSQHLRCILLSTVEQSLHYVGGENGKLQVWSHTIDALYEHGRIYNPNDQAFTIPVHSVYQKKL